MYMFKDNKVLCSIVQYIYNYCSYHFKSKRLSTIWSAITYYIFRVSRERTEWQGFLNADYMHLGTVVGRVPPLCVMALINLS
uniref:Uncharacterized protein n=1 Tax=Pararge aegeria TaxID=116150 RepID=S4NMK8_9NEOP